MPKINDYFTLVRGWSLPISLFSCILPFCWGIFAKGNIFYGLLALLGVILVHFAANLADDFFDYKKIVKEFGTDFDREKLGLQKEKCLLISQGIFSVEQVGLISCLLFFIAFLIGLFFTFKVGFDVMIIAVITFILSVLYSKFTYIGLGELAIGIIFCPLLYMGMFFVMTGHYSLELFLISLAIMPILVGILFNHTMLDFDFDKNHAKRTICSMLKTRQNAWKMLCCLELSPYLILLCAIFMHKISLWFGFVFLSLPYAICVLYLIKQVLDCKPDDFFRYFKPPMKLFVFFVSLTIISKIFAIYF